MYFNTGLILMYSARINYNDVYKQRKLDFINNSVMILLFVLLMMHLLKNLFQTGILV